MRHFILFLCLFLYTNLTTAQNCTCAESFAQLKAGFETNYALFKIKVTDKNRAVYQSFADGIAAKAANTSPKDCQKLLENYLAFFNDGHVWVDSNEEQPQVFKTKPLTAANFKKYLSDRAETLHPIEGIWQSSSYRVAIIKDDTPENKAFVGVVLETKNDSWKAGEIKIELAPQADGSFQVDYYMGDHSLRELTAKLLENNKILQLKGLSGWSKHAPLAADEEPLSIDQYDPLNPTLKILDKNNILLTIPTFQVQYETTLDALIKKHHTALTSTPNLIIDIRENGGGGDGTYYDLMGYIYTDTIVLPMSGMYLSERNTAHFRTWFADSDTTEWDAEEIRMHHYMNTLSDTLVYWSEDDFFNVSYDTVYAFPRNVAILTSKETLSSAETFLLRAHQSRKVMTFGENTGAGVDGFNVHNYPMECYTVWYPTGTRSKFLPVDAVEPLGLRPDFPMNPNDPKMIKKVMQRLARMY